jgi:hypothetical protein
MTQTGFRHCPSCGTALHGRFCSACGEASDQPGPGVRRIPWSYVIGGGLAALAAAVVMIQAGPDVAGTVPAPISSAPPLAALAPSGTARLDVEGTPPDLSAMTPRERFDRLFDRVMRASEGGDAATVTTFSPMALAAYAMLDTPDIDARFHAGLVRIATGDMAGASTLADSIVAELPGHLFGSLLKGRIAELTKDPAALSAARQAFLTAYPAETTARRPEYDGHKAVLDRFFQESSR